MKKLLLYSYTKKVKVSDANVHQHQSHLILFFPYKNIFEQKSDIQVQLRSYFYSNILPDRVIILCFKYNEEEVKDFFGPKAEIYNYIPNFSYNDNIDSIHILSLNSDGFFTTILGEKVKEEEVDNIYRRGLVRIFNKNGGLIIAQSAHHFVFPSGKHCDRFLRTGNVLIHGVEILFIASALKRYFKDRLIKYIYCDTSSINSLAYAYISMNNDLADDHSNMVHVESFGSYELFEKQKFESSKDTIYFISSSTSGSILDRMVTNSVSGGRSIDSDRIAIIYGLSVKNIYQSNVICDLSYDVKINPEGLDDFKTDNVKKGDKCKFCENGSKPLKVEGDVFLLESPLVNGHIMKRSIAPQFLKDISDFYKKNDLSSVVKCYYKENGGEKKYEIYIDVEMILKEFDNRISENSPYQILNKKLEKFILQNIPASLKYMITLPDESSCLLAKIIAKVLRAQGLDFSDERILTLNRECVSQIDKNDKGTIAIISSSVVTGRNLLYISRVLRDYEDTYQRIYFNYLNRTQDIEHHKFLKSNIGLGEYGTNSHKIFDVETIFCPNESQNTPWHIEFDLLKEINDYYNDNSDWDNEIINFCDERIKLLSSCANDKGLCNNLFLPRIDGGTLKIRKGFAFSPYLSGKQHDVFINNSTQSEIYFIISCILNDLRNSNILKQTEYVRNLIAPGNFVRFNDGIIQAALLRAAKKEELNYSLSPEMDQQMKSILGDMITHLEDDHAEALNEFFYAIAVKKLILSNEVLNDCIDLLQEQDYYNKNDSILKGFVQYIISKIAVRKNAQQKFVDGNSAISTAEIEM